VTRLRHTLWAAAALLILLTGCDRSPSPWALHDISGLMPPLAFTLHDGSGQTRHADDFQGKLVLLYFGYTHCPDICPTTLARLVNATRKLGAAADRTRILFVSVDPARDTPAVLQRYQQAFGPGVTALSGTPAQLRTLTRRYRVSFGLGQPDADGRYEVSHSSAVFIFDRDGAARLLATGTDSAEKISTDLERLLGDQALNPPAGESRIS